MTGFHVESKTDAIDLANGIWHTHILTTGVELGVFEAIDETPRTADELVAELDLHAENGYRLLRALASMGLLEEDQNRQFSISPTGELLKSEHPESIRGLVTLNKEAYTFTKHLPAIVREGGETAPKREFDMSYFDIPEVDPEFGQMFNDAMDSFSKLQSPWIREMFAERDFNDASHICDVAGGRGHLLSLLLQDRPHLKGTVLEVPSVVEEQDGRWPEQMGVDERVSYAAGDMFESVPSADYYVMKYILHDWSDDSCKQLLSTIHEDSPEDARLFSISHIVPEDGSRHISKHMDIQMMVSTGGRERTLSEFDTLLEAAGWERVDVTYPENCRMGVIKATKA